MVVVSAVPKNLPASKETDEVFQDVTARSSLHDGKFGSNLPSESHLAATVDGTAKATFPIYEANHPSGGLEPFLLVFRTRRVVTGHITDRINR